MEWIWYYLSNLKQVVTVRVNQAYFLFYLFFVNLFDRKKNFIRICFTLKIILTYEKFRLLFWYVTHH